jgi:hypothetical protein
MAVRALRFPTRWRIIPPVRLVRPRETRGGCGWAEYLANPAGLQVLADVEKAAELAPADPLLSQSVACLRSR